MTVKSTPLHKRTEPHKQHSYESSRQSLTRITSALFCLSKSSSRTCLTLLAEVSAEGLERCTDRSSETRSLSSSSAVSLEQARTLWQQQCRCETCQSRRTPKHDASETRYRLCSRWRQFSRPKVRLLDDEERPPKSTTSRPKTKKRCRSISSRPLEGRRARSSSPLTTNIITTHDATLRRIVAVDTGTQKSAVTAPIAAEGTTATRTGWPQSH